MEKFEKLIIAGNNYKFIMFAAVGNRLESFITNFSENVESKYFFPLFSNDEKKLVKSTNKFNHFQARKKTILFVESF